MSTDPKQTLPSSAALGLCETQDDNSLSTTLIQPTTRSRRSELSRTPYWEQRSSGNEHKPLHGKTQMGLGPNDPLVQAVHTVKLQLMQATQPQPPAAPQPQAEPQVQLPKRHPKPFLIAAAAVGFSVCAAAISALTTRPSSNPHPAPALVQPAPPSVAAASTPGPAAPQTLENASERAAVDALFAGDYTLARRHYSALAQTHPEQPAFAEAARILSRNAAADPD